VAYPLEAWDGAAFKGGYDPIPECEVKGAIEVLFEVFGGTTTDTGHKLLDSHIGLIYGDSITPVRCLAILEGLEAKGFASGNVVFGVGSYTYQCNTRDTFGFAVKATYSVVNGKPVNIFKDPKTDQKKKSAKGLLFVGHDDDGEIMLLDEVSPELEKLGMLKTRFIDGVFVNQVTLDEIRARLA
jgi:nicotinamide phosphoribosyltransferase